MRKEYLYIIFLIACILVVVTRITKLINIAFDNSEKIKTDKIIEDIYSDKEAITTSNKEEKISPNATFALQKVYDECNHFDYEEAELPKELVNKTEQEIEDYYSDWEISKFSSNELILTKEINGYCNQHFVIKLDGDVVNIYRLGTLGELNKYKSTEIYKDYLPEGDVEKLKKGITVYGEGKLSAILEDYE